MTETKQLATSQPKTQLGVFKNFINGNVVQKLFTDRIGKQSADFTNALIEIVSSNSLLQTCDPNEIIHAALKSASLHLPLNQQLGRAYVLPFKNKGKLTPTFVIGYKGIIELAKRSGRYKTLNCGEIYEGQIKSQNVITGEMDIDPLPTSNKIVGFFAYMKELNGFEKILYMTTQKMAEYAKTYSPSLKYNDKVTVQNLLDKFQLHSEHGPETGTGWLSNSIMMGRKTVISQLLDKWGNLSIEELQAIKTDIQKENSLEIIRDNEAAAANQEFTPAEEVTEVPTPEEDKNPQQEDNPDPFPGE